MKQIIISLLMAFLPMVAMADAVEIDGIYYDLVTKAKTAKVISNPNKYSGNIIIPPSISYEGNIYTVTTISGFYNCTGLTSITIPNSVTSITEEAFGYCTGLKSVYITDIAAWCRVSFETGASNPLYYAHHLYLNGEEIKNLIIPNSINIINRHAFNGCSGLNSLSIPNSVTSIGFAAFNNCSGLVTLSIPNSVTTIDNYAFANCSGLSSLTIPNSVTSIGDAAFSGCSGLSDISIPNNLTTISNEVFNGCSHLTSILIPNSVTSIGRETFQGCINLMSISFSNNLTFIGYRAFSGCNRLTSIYIPNSVSSISSYAFERCSSLNTLSIGSGMSSIGYEAFANCPELKDVYCYAENVPNTNNNAFDGSYIDYATLHVSSSSVNAYRQAEPWKNFKSIVALDGTTPETQKCSKPSITYQNGQLKMTCATEGAQFVTDITDTDIKKHYDAIISLAATYNVSVYATKTGYENSDVSSIILCWIDQAPSISTGTVQVPALPVLIKSEDGWLTVEGADDGTQVTVYTIDGMQAGCAVSQNGTAIVGTNLRTGSVAIVKIGNKSVKVVL